MGVVMCTFFADGYRSYGDNIPGYAMGAYFPGDEPEIRCEITHRTCTNLAGDNPADCAAAQKTPWICPECQSMGIKAELVSIHGRYHCSRCGSSWDERGLAKAIASEYERLLDMYEREQETSSKMAIELNDLKEKISIVAKAVS